MQAQFPEGYSAAGSLDAARSQLRHGADYLMAAHTAPDRFVVQVRRLGAQCGVCLCFFCLARATCAGKTVNHAYLFVLVLLYLMTAPDRFVVQVQRTGMCYV